jgi:methyltransferase (TIGR00027 family)
MLHLAGERWDPQAAAIMERLPMTSNLGMALLLKPLLWIRRWTGYSLPWFVYPERGTTPTFSTMMHARTRFFDDALSQHSATCTQLVILGAGFDTRAFTHGSGYERIFELDAPATHALKKKLLADIGAAHPGSLVAVDFQTTDWLKALEMAGFDRAKPTAVLCEGLTYYLSRDVVQGILRSVASLAPGSVVAFDYFGERMTESKPMLALMRGVGEPFRFGLPTRGHAAAHAASLVNSCGLRVLAFQTQGEDDEGSDGCWGGLVVAGS